MTQYLNLKHTWRLRFNEQTRSVFINNNFQIIQFCSKQAWQPQHAESVQKVKKSNILYFSNKEINDAMWTGKVQTNWIFILFPIFLQLHTYTVTGFICWCLFGSINYLFIIYISKWSMKECCLCWIAHTKSFTKSKLCLNTLP